MKYLNLARERMLGYPLNCTPLSQELITKLTPYLGFVINNLGDPFVGGSYRLNSFRYEREIVRYFMKLYHLDPDRGWGYVSNCGSESNMRGLSFGVKKFPNSIIYTSDKSHYSILKSCVLMGKQLTTIKTDRWHQMDLVDFKTQLNPKTPAIVNVNIGTTMAGACDNLSGIIEILESKSIPYYIHVDAALSGFILPFIDESKIFDFRFPISSITVSGHKMLGCPIPCGIFICRKDVIQTECIEYIGSCDTTMCGSRDGFTVLLLWHLLRNIDATIKQTIKKCFEVKHYTIDKLHDLNWHYWSIPDSTTIVLQKPSNKIVKKWQLAVQDREAHIIVMPHVTYDMIDQFVHDLVRSSVCVRSFA